MIIDTHSHIYLCKKKSIPEIVEDLKKDEIEKILSIGIDIPTSKTCVELARKYEKIVFASVGIHPCDIGRYIGQEEKIFTELEKIIQENREYVKAIGETGFDFYRTPREEYETTFRSQADFFARHIELAKKYSLPVVIHMRNSKEETFQTLQKHDFRHFILHCYGEDLEFAEKILEFAPDCKISFSGIVTFPNAKSVQETAKNIPIKNILVETDCPYLAPQEVRGQENYPNYTKYTLKKIFELREESNFEVFSEQIYKNSVSFFDL